MSRATRQSQPYRKGAREPGAALTAMTRGRTASGGNPSDAMRAVQLLASEGKKRKRNRPARPDRPARPTRPPRY